MRVSASDPDISLADARREAARKQTVFARHRDILLARDRPIHPSLAFPRSLAFPDEDDAAP